MNKIDCAKLKYGILSLTNKHLITNLAFKLRNNNECRNIYNFCNSKKINDDPLNNKSKFYRDTWI
jgi:hypothetical protein